MFLRKGVLKICSKFIGGHPFRSVISIKLQSSFIEIALRYGCSPVNLLHPFRTPFPSNTSGWLPLKNTFWHAHSLEGFQKSHNIFHDVSLLHKVSKKIFISFLPTLLYRVMRWGWVSQILGAKFLNYGWTTQEHYANISVCLFCVCILMSSSCHKEKCWTGTVFKEYFETPLR